MSQLKMLRLPAPAPKALPLPEGYSLVTYRSPEDRAGWCECCRSGLIADDAGTEAYEKAMYAFPDLRETEDVFFLDFDGRHVGTVTAFVEANGLGHLHMVGIRTEFRGKGLNRYLMNAAVRHLEDLGAARTLLLTDEWRKNAIRSYLHAGFCPMEYDTGMPARWAQVLTDLNIESAPMLLEDGSFFCTVRSLK